MRHITNVVTEIITIQCTLNTEYFLFHKRMVKGLCLKYVYYAFISQGSTRNATQNMYE